MRCPECKERYKVNHSDRSLETVNVRNCVCRACGARFMTLEQVVRISPGKPRGGAGRGGAVAQGDRVDRVDRRDGE